MWFTTKASLILTRLETKLDTALATQTDHEARIRILERARWPLPSVGALAGVAGVALSLYSISGR